MRPPITQQNLPTPASTSSLALRTTDQSGMVTKYPAGDDAGPIDTASWPSLQSETLTGFVGEFVELATRNSEADPAAVLATILTRFGAELDSPYYLVGDTTHRTRLFTAIVGASSKSRKGTSSSPVKALFTFGMRAGMLLRCASPVRYLRGKASSTLFATQ